MTIAQLFSFIAQIYNTSQQCQWCLCIVWLNIQQLTHRHCSVMPNSISIWVSQDSSTVSLYCFTQAQWQVVWPLQLHCLSRLNLFIPCVCMCAYLSPSHDRQWVAPVLAVLTITHMSMLIYWNTWVMSGCTRNFGTCVTNVGWMIHRIDSLVQLLPVHGLLSWSMWGSLKLTPIIICP